MNKTQMTWFLRQTVVQGREKCWPWLGSIDKYGYGKFGNRGAHRVAYEHFIGAVPEGLQLDHTCRNRSCVNPWHLDPVTIGDNIRRGHEARGVAGGRDNPQRRQDARRRYDLRKRLGLAGPSPGESRPDYHDRIGVAADKHPMYHALVSELTDSSTIDRARRNAQKRRPW